MREMATHTQIQAQYLVTRLEYGQTYSSIGLGSTMRLNIGINAVKYFFKPVYGQLFGLVNDFTTPVITTARITLRVLVRHHVPHSLHYLQGSKIFRGNQFNTVPLSFKFFLDKVKNELVSLHGAKLGQL